MEVNTTNNVANNLAVVIGAMKSGTTSIYSYFKHHRDITLTRNKECDFFKDEQLYQKGHEWYESLFDKPASRYIDVSPNYSKRHIFPGVAEKLADYAPQAKIIYIMHNPVDRMISHYMHNQSAGRVHCSFNSLLKKKKRRNYILSSCYAWQLEEYEAHFSKDQIFPILFEEFIADPGNTMNRIYQYLGLVEIDGNVDYTNVEHQGSHKSRPSFIDTNFSNAKINTRLKKVLPGRFSKRRRIVRPHLSKRKRRQLMQLFKEDIQQLEQKYNLDCSVWR